MILFTNQTKIDLAAVQALSLEQREDASLYLEADLSAITDASLTIVDLSGDGSFQNMHAPSVLVETFLQCGLPASVKTINFIISDVDVTQSMRAYGYQVAYEFLKYGREMSTHVCTEHNFLTCIVPPPQEGKNWKVYGYAYDNLQGKIVDPYQNFNYEDFIKLPECKIIWEGKNLDDWLNSPKRHSDNKEQYGKTVDFTSIVPLPIAITKGSIINAKFPDLKKLIDEENSHLPQDEQKAPSKAKDSITSKPTSPNNKQALFSSSLLVTKKEKSVKTQAASRDEQKEAPTPSKKQKI
jgi:hypothetical protein